MTTEQRRRITDTINTWITPLLLAVVSLVGASTWNKVTMLAEAMPTVQHRVTSNERRIDDHENRLRYVERQVPSKSEWP